MRIQWVAALVAAGMAIGGCGKVPPTHGVVIEEVAAGGGAHRAGLEPGDRLLGWRRAGDRARDLEAAEGLLKTPVDLERVEVTEAPLGPVTVEGVRAGEVFEVALAPAPWRVVTRPSLGSDQLAEYLEGRRRFEAGGADLGLWLQMAARAVDGNRLEEALWLLSEASAGFQRSDRPELASRAEAEAQRLAADDDGLRGWLWARRGATLKPEAAAEAYERALEGALEEPFRAHLLHLRCVAAFRQTGTHGAEGHCREARELWRQLVPGGTDEARSALVLAKWVRNSGRLEEAATLFEELRAVVQGLDPQGPLYADVLSELGITRWRQGNLLQAELLQRQALEIHDRLGMRDVSTGQARMGVGVVAVQRGRLVEAREEFRQALEIFTDTAPATSFEAWSLHGLGLVAAELGDYDAAESHLNRAVEVNRAVPSLLDAATGLSNLGLVAHYRGELARAIELYEEALEVFEGHRPGAIETSRLRGNLGDLHAQAGNLERAQQMLDRSVKWYEENAPGSVSLSAQLMHRGRLSQRGGRDDEAEALFRRSLEIRRRLAPESVLEAEALYNLGRLHRQTGRPDAARRYLEEAVAALETQREQLLSSREDAASFADRFAAVYQELLDLLVELGEEEQAFVVLEGYRAQAFRAMLGARDLLFDGELPAELARRRRELARAYESTQAELSELDARAPAAAVARLVDRLHELRGRREELVLELLEASPRSAYLRSPLALDPAASARALDPGTLLLSFAVLPHQSYLFVLRANHPESLVVHRLGVGEAELRQEVEALLYLVRSPRAAAVPGFQRRSAALYRRLLSPAEGRIAEASRLLVVPDGPLHRLPFAALLGGGEGAASARYLVVEKPLHAVASVAVYAELRARRRASGGAFSGASLVAFGDPDYGARGSPALASLDPPRTAGLSALPASRGEVEGLVKLFPDAEVYLGSEATEERVKALEPKARYVHLACHASVDHRFPLDSYLALSPSLAPGREAENGFLQAWEVFEDLRLEADLVTLSACETGLGRESRGEGLIGLTRAFQYAGARSVLSSLWSVSDRSTRALMSHFYRHLREGRSKDEALRLAQLDLLRHPVVLPQASRGPVGLFLRGLLGRVPPVEEVDASHPFHWAAFQLNGDWR